MRYPGVAGVLLCSLSPVIWASQALRLLVVRTLASGVAVPGVVAFELEKAWRTGKGMVHLE
jgi:hypothetical protein